MDNILRIFVQQLNVFLVLLMLFPAPPLLAQSQTGSFGDLQDQSFSTMPQSDRIGGSSFGTKTRTPGITQFGLPAAESMPSILQGPTYQVHILGEVENPGTYRVPASTRLSEAIELSGGILERGAERTIELRRKGQINHRIDLMAFKLLGDLDSNPYLLDNDVVFVPLKDEAVQIAGAVKRPALYELTGKTTIKELVRLAGGVSPGAARSAPVKVIRFNSGHKKVIDVPFDDNDTAHFDLKNADVVVIPHILTHDKTFDYNVPALPGDRELFYPSFEERIFVIGAVYKPGPYPYSPYYSVREYLTQAGGMTKLAKNKKMHVITSTGITTEASKVTAINPGDTVVVPERYMRPESWLTLALGLTSAALGITTTVLTLAR